tara:strand:+ start:1857 stop:2702 length:846 start_codon:yes stop_codon:yes gene_type:complete
MADKRSALKQGQIDILELLYKYRFGSRQLLADSLGIKAGSSLYEKLEVLVKHNLIGKRQEKHLKLLGVPAAYYLTPKGLRTLQALPDHEYITDSVIKVGYKDKSVSQVFVSHTLKVYRLTNALKRHYPDLKVYLRRDMSHYSYFPSNPPDAFLSLMISDTPKRFFLDVIPDSLPRNVLDRQITNYGQFFEDGGWEVTNSELPALLLIADKGTTETRTKRAVRAALGRLEMDDELSAYITTFTALENGDESGKIWTSIGEPDELLSLPELSCLSLLSSCSGR